MKFLRALWLAIVRMFCLCGRVTLLLLWIFLLALLYVQTQVATLDALVLPDFAKRGIQQRLLEAGLLVDFSRARFDTSGRVLLENVSVGDPSVLGPLATARSVRAQFGAWPLLVGVVNLRELRVTGARLLVPASASSTK